MSDQPQSSLVDDPDIPGLGLLLADEPLRAWLAERGEVLDRRCYLRYKPRTSCVAGLRLASGPAFLLAVSAAAQPKLNKYLTQARPGDILGADPGRLLLLASFTADRDLPALTGLERNIGRLLRHPGNPEATTLVHKPQRRWVGLVRSGEQRTPVVLRAYRRSRLTEAGERLGMAQRASGVLRVPRLLARSERSELLAASFLPGMSLEARHSVDGGRSDRAAAGEALARLHRCDARGLPAALVSEPGLTAALVGALAPHLAARVTDLMVTLRGTRPSRPADTLCHGDFSMDQVLIDDQGALGLIDWDRAGRGNPAGDLASSMAAEPDESARSGLLAGYSLVRPVPPDLEWQLASARLQRLAEPFRLASPTWLAELERGVAVLESTMP